MTRHPLAGRIYVFAMIALGAVVMAAALSSWELARPGVFAALLVMSVISSALKVDMPLGVGSSCMSLCTRLTSRPCCCSVRRRPC